MLFQIYISNLPHDTTESELRAYFHHASCDCHSISVPVDKVTGRGRGFAHIEFKDKATMVRALTANGKTIKGRTVTVEVGRSQGNRGDRDRDRRGDGKFGGERKGKYIQFCVIWRRSECNGSI
jgi:RNA recognition motif-containing protein